ncbi:hypothetical protein OTU49_016747, partial [Cherax quadricarinatus]
AEVKMVCETLLPGLGHFEYLLVVVGLVYLGKVLLVIVWSLACGFRAHFWSRLWDKRLVETYGKWAVVTGCTDGIGKEYAKELAKRGMNIVLISRSLDKLQKVSDEIVQEYKVQTEIVQKNFLDGRPIYEDIRKRLQDKEIGILVNNVGMNSSTLMEFIHLSEKDIWSFINVNVASVPGMTNLVLPGMLSRRKGAIINIGSISGLYPVALAGMYTATKAFVDHFSQSLDWEYRDSGITVQTVLPSYVSTNMITVYDTFRKPGIFVPTASTFVSNAIHTLGYARRTTGYWAHGLQIYMLENIISQWIFMHGTDSWFNFLQRNVKECQS